MALLGHMHVFHCSNAVDSLCCCVGFYSLEVEYCMFQIIIAIKIPATSSLAGEVELFLGSTVPNIPIH